MIWNLFRLPLKFTVLCALLFATGCSTYRMNCPTPDLNMKAWPGNEETAPYSVAVIELDDFGEMWDVEQMYEAVDQLKEVNAENPQGVRTILFVHGWHQNANWDEGRLPWFIDRLKISAERSARRAEELGLEKPQPIVGVFIAWRGLMWNTPLVKQVSFWNRLSAADRVASIDMTEILGRLAANVSKHPDSKCILIGHSMGGTVLERALAPYLASGLVSGPLVKDGGKLDLVVLANPAVQALYTKQTVDLLKRMKVQLFFEAEDGTTKPAPGPWLITLSAEHDVVTQKAFPFGQFITSLFHRYRKYEDPDMPSQKQLSRQTAAHTMLLSHKVKDLGEEGFVFEKVPGSYNDSIFWVAQVPESVMADHSNLESPRFSALLDYLMDLNELRDPWVRLNMVADIEAAEQSRVQRNDKRDERQTSVNDPVPWR